MQTKNVVEWIDDLRGKMHTIDGDSTGKEELAKTPMKTQYDNKAKPRKFSEGSLVLIRIHDLIGKLEDCWDGPFEMIRNITNVTYELAVLRRRSKKRVAHINMLK